MKKIILILALFTILLPGAAFAATFKATNSGSTTVSNNETLKNAYLAGNTVNVNGTITEDLLAAGNTITVTGPVNNNANIAGNSITLNSTVGKSLRATGSNITINNNIGSDLLVAGGAINLGPSATVNDDFLAAGGTIDLSGQVNGKAYLSGGQITINGKVNGDVIIKGSGKVTVGSNAIIGGNLNYQAQEEAMISSGAKINGNVDFKKIANQNFASKKIKTGMTLFSLGTALATYILLLVLIYLLPKLMRTATEKSFAKPWENMGTGFVYLIVIPFAAFVLLFTLIGIPISLLGLGLYMTTIGLAKILVPILTGSLIYKWVKKDKVYRLDWATALIGIIATTILGMIPVIGWIPMFVLFLIALSLFARGGMDLIRTQRAK